MENKTILDKLICSKWGLVITWLPTIFFLFLPFFKKTVGELSLIDLMIIGLESNGDWGLGQYYTYLNIIFFGVIVILSFGKKETVREKIQSSYRGNKWLINILLIFMLFISYRGYIILSWITQVLFIVYYFLMYRMVNYHFECYYNYKPSHDSSNENQHNKNQHNENNNE